MVTLLLYSILFLREVSHVFSFQHSQTSVGRAVTLLLWFLWAHGPVQFSRLTLCNPVDCSTPGFPVRHHLLEPIQTHGHHIGDAICHPTILPSVVRFSSHLQSFPATGSFLVSQFFASGDQSIGVFSFSISPSNEHPGLISFSIDGLDLLAVQGTLNSLLQHHSFKASILLRSAFFIVQFSHPYMTTGKTIALTRWTFAGKVVSLLFNMLSRLVITFLPWSKCLLISWLQSPSAVILEPPKIKSDIASTVSPSISHEVMGPDAMILVF